MIYQARVQDKSTGKTKTVKLGQQSDTQSACRAAFVKLYKFGEPITFEIIDVYPVK